MECIGKGKAHRPYEFGVKVSVATPLRRCRGDRFVAHVAVPSGKSKTDRVSLSRAITDAVYRDHNAPRRRGLRVYTSGQKCGVTDQIKRKLPAAIRDRAGNRASESRASMKRNHLAGRQGDAIKALMTVVGYNFRFLVACLAALLCVLQVLALRTAR